MTKSKRGGIRIASPGKKNGRPKGEPTTTIAFRVKTVIADEAKEVMKKFIESKNG